MKYKDKIEKEFKVCNVCKHELPCNSDYFHLSYRSRDGYKGICKECLQDKYYSKREGQRGKEDLTKVFENRLKAIKDRNAGNSIDFGIEYLFELWNNQKGVCAVSGIPMTYILYSGKIRTNVSIDRKDSMKGYSRDNIQLVCHIINLMKLDMSMGEMLYYCSAVLNTNK